MGLFKIICWVLILLTRLRFPPGSSIATILKNRYNNGALAAFRKFQRTELKLSKAKLDLSFLKNCKRLGVFPHFLNFKVANRRLQNSAAYRQCQRKLLDEEIRNKQFRIRELSSEPNQLHPELGKLVSSLDLLHLKFLSDSENTRKLSRHEKFNKGNCFD